MDALKSPFEFQPNTMYAQVYRTNETEQMKRMEKYKWEKKSNLLCECIESALRKWNGSNEAL